MVNSIGILCVRYDTCKIFRIVANLTKLEFLFQAWIIS